MPLFLNKHFKIIIHISFACVCVFEALFIHRYIEKPSDQSSMDLWTVLVCVYSRIKQRLGLKTEIFHSLGFCVYLDLLHIEQRLLKLSAFFEYYSNG